MLTRKIVIESCEMCPHKQHRGGFGEVMYFPICFASNYREIPHKVDTDIAGQRFALSVTDIPEWCPLEINGGI